MRLYRYFEIRISQNSQEILRGAVNYRISGPSDIKQQHFCLLLSVIFVTIWIVGSLEREEFDPILPCQYRISADLAPGSWYADWASWVVPNVSSIAASSFLPVLFLTSNNAAAAALSIFTILPRSEVEVASHQPSRVPTGIHDEGGF